MKFGIGSVHEYGYVKRFQQLLSQRWRINVDHKSSYMYKPSELKSIVVGSKEKYVSKK